MEGERTRTRVNRSFDNSRISDDMGSLLEICICKNFDSQYRSPDVLQKSHHSHPQPQTLIMQCEQRRELTVPQSGHKPIAVIPPTKKTVLMGSVQARAVHVAKMGM
jgi:hypothetical protein